MEIALEESAFPKLSSDEMKAIGKLAKRRELEDREVLFKAGDAKLDFHVVEAGQIRIINPTDDDAEVTIHDPREFCGDIDMLTGRPVIVTAGAKGKTTVLSVPHAEFRNLLSTIPRLGEKLLTAFTARRALLQKAGILGLKVIGPRHQPDTNEVREFLFKNFIPYTFYDSEADDGRKQLQCLHKRDEDTPVIECGPDNVLVKPDLGKLAKCAGVRHECPDGLFDLAVVGAGPAGMTAAVYAASEALSTIVLDRLGPGGQAGGSSMIENFIGFPSGLSGVELAQRGVLQMLKFGAMLNTPVKVARMEVGEKEHVLHTSNGETVRARIVLAATGVRWRRLEAKGADRFERAGIFYAATAVESRVCVGDEVAVIGGGNSAGQAAMFISECAKKVHLLVRGPKLKEGMSNYLIDRIRNNPKICLHPYTEVTEVLGEEERVKEIEVVDLQTKKRSRLKVAAMFVFIGAEPHADWLPKEVARSATGYVMTGTDAEHSGQWPLKNRGPCSLETTVPRLLAGGDLRHGATKRVGFAVGDGSLAVTCVHRLRQED